MSTEIRPMEEILPGRRAPTQRAVLRALLGGCSRNPEIAEELGLTTNAVSAALHQLVRSGASGDRLLRDALGAEYAVKEVSADDD